MRTRHGKLFGRRNSDEDTTKRTQKRIYAQNK